MKRVAAALLICLLSQSFARAEEPGKDFPNRMGVAGTTTLNRAIQVEAVRLAKSMPTRRSAQSSQAAQDQRHPCVRHGTGCGALIGFTVGFLAGVMNHDEDIEPMAWGLLFTGPIGAGIGAAVGWCIAEGTKPQQP